MRMKLRHYGASNYRRDLFIPVVNRYKPQENNPLTDFGLSPINKPYGGLWTSLVNSQHSWYDWCKENSFGDTSNFLILIFKGMCLS